MPKSTSAVIATQIRQMLKRGGSSEYANGVQWFFKEEIKSYGWYTPRFVVRPCVSVTSS
jgi:hypothetical protein